MKSLFLFNFFVFKKKEEEKAITLAFKKGKSFLFVERVVAMKKN
jgi:hypothetical protein